MSLIRETGKLTGKIVSALGVILFVAALLLGYIGLIRPEWVLPACVIGIILAVVGAFLVWSHTRPSRPLNLVESGHSVDSG